MKQVKLTFTTRHNNIDFEITYTTRSKNVNVISEIKIAGYALDIYDVEENKPGDWEHFEFAMKNNADTYWSENPQEDSLFEMIADITRSHAKFAYGIDLKR